MNKRLLLLVSAVLVTGLLLLMVLKSYTVEIVHAVVVNAVVQKAPEGYDQVKIRGVFDDALALADEGEYRDRYLGELQEVFHSMEKRQYLESEEMDRLLAEFK
jgi:hypothetical protein